MARGTNVCVKCALFNKATVFTNGYLDLGAAKRTGDFNILFNGAADSITADPLGVKAETIKLPANMPYTLASTPYMQLNENTVYVLEFDYWSDTNWASADYPYFYVGGDLPARVYLQAGALPKTTLQRARFEISPNAQTALVRFVNFGPSSVYVCNVLFYPKYALGQKSVDLNPFRYCGEYLDLETNNYYLRARYYVPSTGRFIQQDAWDYMDPNDPLGLNLYTYCYNSPIRYYDPNGNSIQDILQGFASSVDRSTFSGLANWFLNTITGYRYDYVYDSEYDYYLGRTIGDAFSIAIGLGGVFSGVSTIVKTVQAGAAVTAGTMGGAAVLAYAGVSIAVTAGVAEITIGGAMMVAASQNFYDDYGKVLNAGNTKKYVPKTGDWRATGETRGKFLKDNGYTTEKVRTEADNTIIENVRDRNGNIIGEMHRNARVDGKVVPDHIHFNSDPTNIHYWFND